MGGEQRMSVKVFIDGSSGTTGLRIADRLAARPEIELLSISAEGRKDVNGQRSSILPTWHSSACRMRLPKRSCLCSART